MDTDQILFLSGHYYWATDIILESAGEVTPAQFTLVPDPDPDPGRGGLRGILVHMLDSEIRWRLTVQKLPLTPALADDHARAHARLQSVFSQRRQICLRVRFAL